MIKLIRSNQKMFLTGLTIVAMITFVLNFGNKGGAGSDHAVNDRPFGTINGKTIYTSEVTEARSEIAALKKTFDFEDQQKDVRGNLENPQAAFFQFVISQAGQKIEWYVQLRHEANDANIQFDKDFVGTVVATYTRDLNPDDEYYPAVYSGTVELLRIMSRYEQVAGTVKISKPTTDLELVQSAETLSLDLIQYKAADFLSAVPAPTTQQLQDQFTRFAAVEPHHPDPTTNPSGIGYRLPVRAKLKYVRLTPDAVTAAVAATKFTFPAPDWEVQARKYYLAHLDEFPTTAPTTAPTTSPTTTPTTAAAIAAAIATIKPTGPLPFPVVHDQILTKIRQPMVSSLTDQVQNFITSTLSNDWQAYSVFVTAGKAGPEPASSLGVPYTSPAYFAKLLDAVQSKYNVVIIVGETAGGLSDEQITALPDIGTPELSDLAKSLAKDYLHRLGKSDKSAPAWLNHPSTVTAGKDTTSTVIFRLSEVLPSEPAPNLASVQAQVDTDVRTAAAYKLAQAKAKDVVTNISDHPLFLVADGKNPLIHLDRLSMFESTLPKITPDLGTATTTFMKKAFELLGTYDPRLNRNPSETIELPDQGRVFAVQLGFVDAGWNSESYFYTTLGVRRRTLQEQQQFLFGGWFNPQAVIKRLNFVSAGKNNSSDSE